MADAWGDAWGDTSTSSSAWGDAWGTDAAASSKTVTNLPLMGVGSWLLIMNVQYIEWLIQEIQRI